jgi:hypothetical protein
MNTNVSAKIRAFLKGKPISKKETLVVRTAIVQLLLLCWQQAFRKLPELVVPKETLVYKLPFLSDGEKGWLSRIIDLRAKTLGLSYPAGATVDAVDDYFRECLFLEDARCLVLSLEIKGMSPCLFGYAESSMARLPCDFRTLRVCTLLYRPRQEWSAEELAIMREGGIKSAFKGSGRKFGGC